MLNAECRMPNIEGALVRGISAFSIQHSAFSIQHSALTSDAA
jgi:hypothetical protein